MADSNGVVVTATATGTTLALGPQSLKPVIGWLAELSQVQPLPNEDAQLGIATLGVFLGGGLVWLTVTLVRYALAKRGIIAQTQEKPDA